MTLDDLLLEALRLSPDERLQLADQLLQSVDPAGEAEVRVAWDSEIRKRIEEIDSGTVQLVEHDQAMQRLFATA